MSIPSKQRYRELLTFKVEDRSTINRATHLLRASHNLEQIADRVTTVCGRLGFAVTGTLEPIRLSNY